MKRKATSLAYLVSLVLTPFIAYGQGGFALSLPVIYSTVEVENNWSPPTAINRKNQFEGTSVGYGVNLNYSFRPTFIIKNQHILVKVGAGYFEQRFNLIRPFDYASSAQPIYYTDYYSYDCFQALIGITYHHSINPKYSLLSNLSYSWLSSFRQEYTPSYSAGADHSTQVLYQQINFGNMLMISIGVNKHLGNKFSLGLDLLVPLYTRWRNDEIFKDNPHEFSHPKFSLGSNISMEYRL